ncbi:MAG: hypothetical protein A2045_08605 [Rhodocyclales bacterium GWA2_65_20]|nr:MAG: hypothetical protein A2045_08605 [Rhodocyclales bacterium GWA2_65_20]
MKARWQALAAKFAALQQREKQLTAGAVVVVIVMGGHTFWVEPAQLRVAALTKQIAQQKTEMQTLQAQVAGLRSQLKDPDAPNKAALAEAQAQVAAAEQALLEYDQTLVPPQRMPQLLQSLFVRHRGLELMSMQTLPAALLLAPPAATAESRQPEARTGDGKKPAPPPAVKGGNIHKHGIEIRMAGNYLDLLAYVADLEQLPQRLLWSRMTLAVTAYPRSELTLTVYTLSLDPTWMTV